MRFLICLFLCLPAISVAGPTSLPPIDLKVAEKAIQFLARHSSSSPSNPLPWKLASQFKNDVKLNKNFDFFVEKFHSVSLTITKEQFDKDGLPNGLSKELFSLPLEKIDLPLFYGDGKIHLVLRVEADFFIIISSSGPNRVDLYSGTSSPGDLVISVGYKLEHIEDPSTISHEKAIDLTAVMGEAQDSEWVSNLHQKIAQHDNSLSLISSSTIDNKRFILNFGFREFKKEHENFVKSAVKAAGDQNHTLELKKPGYGFAHTKDGDQYFIQNFTMNSYYGVFSGNESMKILLKMLSIPGPVPIYSLINEKKCSQILEPKSKIIN